MSFNSETGYAVSKRTYASQSIHLGPAGDVGTSPLSEVSLIEKEAHRGAISRGLLWIFGAVAVTLPAMVSRLGAWDLPLSAEPVVFGLAIMAAGFLLTWAVDVAEQDISQTLAVAFLALIILLPEYSVDVYLAWAGADPQRAEYASYAAANMTGANRLLLGLAWPMLFALFWLKQRKGTFQFNSGRAVELTFLLPGTLYSFTIVLKGFFSILDAAVLIGLFWFYVVRSSKTPSHRTELTGPGVAIDALGTTGRRISTAAIFLFSAVVILLSAEPFAGGLINSGRSLGIDEFILVHWLAPLASEAPEFVIITLFALKSRENAAMGTLLSSPLNQWTLLVASLPLAYGLHGLLLGDPGNLVLDPRQRSEFLLTGAQSLFGAIALARMRLSWWAALTLATLFLTQLTLSIIYQGAHLRLTRDLFSLIYLTLAVALLLGDKGRARVLWRTVGQGLGFSRLT